ncbi:MAG TPA: 2-dehydropantoate 2-reductase [Cytophagales bacterium]
MTNGKIFIIGAGAIGKVLAVALTWAGREVVLLRGSVDNQPRRVEQFHVELPDHSELRAEVPVDTLGHFATLNGLIVLTNKSYGNAALAEALRAKAGASPILLLQNGLGVEQPFLAQGFSEVYRCVLFATSQALDANRLRFKPVAVSAVGTVAGSAATLQRVVAGVNSPVFPFRAEPDIGPVIWKKAIINSVFNSVCPLLETDNGVFHREPAALAIARRVIHECVAVAQASGIHLGTQEVEAGLLQISTASDGQLISTLQDIRNGRRTEIDTLNFEVVRIAETLGRGDLVPETRLLGELTKLKADRAQSSGETI